jgi:predicted acyl esterase
VAVRASSRWRRWPRRNRSNPETFYDYEIAIAPTAHKLALGHRLQLRLTSYNMPNALPGTIDFNGSAPATSSFVAFPPATNTVRYGGTDGSSLLLPLSTGA